MHRFFIKTPWLVKKLYPEYTWNMPADDHAVYLTFDDGPHPQITNWVLEELKKYDALATFFCIGENVMRHPEMYETVLAAGHATGNHTQHHPNGWEVADELYLADVAEATKHIRSNLFRPPYGRIRTSQAKQINSAMQRDDVKIIMWDVLSCDFDTTMSKEKCLNNVLKNVEAGSIIVFHDSEKAAPNLMYALPRVMEFLSEKKYGFRKLEAGN